MFFRFFQESNTNFSICRSLSRIMFWFKRFNAISVIFLNKSWSAILIILHLYMWILVCIRMLTILNSLFHVEKFFHSFFWSLCRKNGRRSDVSQFLWQAIFEYLIVPYSQWLQQKMYKNISEWEKLDSDYYPYNSSCLTWADSRFWLCFSP